MSAKTAAREGSGQNRSSAREIEALRAEVERLQRERARLEKQLDQFEAENRRFSEQYVEVEQQNSNLAQLYVASYRLHATLDRVEALKAVQEIICNLIGSEEIAIFETTPARDALNLVASFGIDPAPFRRVRWGRGIIGRCVESGETYLAGRDALTITVPEERSLSACIPLVLDGSVSGAVAIFRLLPQKLGLVAADHELFDLLATQAATALYCTGLHARLTGGARATS